MLVQVLAWASLMGGLLVNPAFDGGTLEGWTPSDPQMQAEAVTRDGRSAARIRVPETAQPGYPLLYQEFEAAPGARIEARVEALGDDLLEGGYGAYASLDFIDAAGARLAFSQSEAAPRGVGWVRLRITAVAPAGTARLRYTLILNGRGAAYFDNASLEVSPAVPASAPTGPVVLSVEGERACRDFYGFGVEDDGWFYNEENRAYGIDARDEALREQRIRAMDPDWVRMFFWLKDWCPTGDWSGVTFDSDNMQSHYRTLDLYQAIGAKVGVVGVEWGMHTAYEAEPEAIARGYGALLDHLIRDKGYTCIDAWTFTNEPNTHLTQHGMRFEKYVAIHEAMHEELERRGLPVQIVISDDAQSAAWFDLCLASETLRRAGGRYASHRYARAEERVFAGDFFASRLEPMAEAGIEQPFLVAEFGFQDARASHLTDPLMREYAYALEVFAFCIEGLNRGVAGFSIWCLHEMDYPGKTRMGYGLWDFKENAWKLRPVGRAYALLTSLSEPGMPVWRVRTTHPEGVRAAAVGDVLYWVNPSDDEVTVALAGWEAAGARYFDEALVAADSSDGEALTLRDGGFAAPARSFGYVRR